MLLRFLHLLRHCAWRICFLTKGSPYDLRGLGLTSLRTLEVLSLSAVRFYDVHNIIYIYTHTDNTYTFYTVSLYFIISCYFIKNFGMGGEHLKSSVRFHQIYLMPRGRSLLDELAVRWELQRSQQV